jgi:Uma2 family endonuclease
VVRASCGPATSRRAIEVWLYWWQAAGGQRRPGCRSWKADFSGGIDPMATASQLTLTQFLALPDTKPASEYIDGEVLQKPMPTWDHGEIQRLISFILTLYLRAHAGGSAGPEVRCIFGPAGAERAYVPDYIFVRAGRRARGEQHFRGAPDLAVEILSPDDRMTQVMEKLRFYLAHGVRVVWLIDPERRTLTVMTPPESAQILVEDDTLDGGDVLPGLSCVVRDILPAIEPVLPEDAH